MSGIDELRLGVEALRAEHGAKWLEAFVSFYLALSISRSQGACGRVIVRQRLC